MGVRCIIAIRQQCFGRPSAAVGVDLSPTHIRIRHAFAMRSEYIHIMFAMCSLSVCYIFAMQKYGFCATKVWFLACKKVVFELQKYGFCFLNVGLLQSVSNDLAICSQCYCNPFAAVGADLSRPHIRIHPQNDERKCACVETNVCI